MVTLSVACLEVCKAQCRDQKYKWLPDPHRLASPSMGNGFVSLAFQGSTTHIAGFQIKSGNLAHASSESEAWQMAP